MVYGIGSYNMSHTAQIAYLNTIKTANTAQYDANTNTISSLNEAIAGHNAEVITLEALVVEVTGKNAELLQGNTYLDEVIAEL